MGTPGEKELVVVMSSHTYEYVSGYPSDGQMPGPTSYSIHSVHPITDLKTVTAMVKKLTSESEASREEGGCDYGYGPEDVDYETYVVYEVPKGAHKEDDDLESEVPPNSKVVFDPDEDEELESEVIPEFFYPN